MARELLLEPAAEQSIPPVIYASSLAAAGPSLGIGGRVETDAVSPVSHYGRSKLAGKTPFVN